MQTMSNRNTILLLILSITILNQCTTFNDVIEIEGGNSNDQTLVLSPNKLVVRLKDNMTEARKQELMDIAHVSEPAEYCSCGGRNIEIWTVDRDFRIEEAVSNLEREEESAGDVEGDREFSFNVEDTRSFDLDFNQSAPIALLSQENNISSVNIAVIDTGVNFDFFPDTPERESKFLFTSANYSNCEDVSGEVEISGWNFVDNNPNVRDSKSHGTYVSKIIAKELVKEGIEFQILPIKVFNNRGVGSYSNIVCALNYIKGIQERGGNINLINASFGVSLGDDINVNDFEVLKGLIEELQNEALVITSAGNMGINTDDRGIPNHFPSGYDSSNILAIGGYILKEEIFLLHPNSNYGRTSIDLLTKFEGYKLKVELPEAGVRDSINLSGTSYATAYITGLAAKLYMDNGRPNPQTLKDIILDSSESILTLRDSINQGRVIIK